MDKKGMHYLSHAIHTSPSLERLHMDHCSLKPSLIEILAGGARQSASLRHLSIRHNRITPKGAPWLAAMLVSDEPIEVYWQSRAYVRRGIRILDLTGNQLQGAITSLAQALAGNKTLTHLILAQCQIHAEDCTTLADALVKSQGVGWWWWNHMLIMVNSYTTVICKCWIYQGIIYWRIRIKE